MLPMRNLLETEMILPWILLNLFTIAILLWDHIWHLHNMGMESNRVQGNVFIGVCHSVNKGISFPTMLWAYTFMWSSGVFPHPPPPAHNFLNFMHFVGNFDKKCMLLPRWRVGAFSFKILDPPMPIVLLDGFTENPTLSVTPVASTIARCAI